MKSILTIALMLLMSRWTAAAPNDTPADSLVILFGNKTRLVIHSDDKNGISQLAKYDLNKLVSDMGLMLDSTSSGEKYLVINEKSTQRYLRDTVIVVTRKDGKVTVTVKDRDKQSKVEKNDENKEGDDSDREYRRNQERRRRNNWNLSIEGVGIGLNGLIQKTSSQAYSSETYELRPIGSRYVSLGVGQMPTIAKGKTASLRLYYALEVSWNNFMFEQDNIAVKTPTGVAFLDAGRDLKKSKLTVATINIPFVPRVTFYNTSGRKLFHLGAGVYGGYRIDSYTKIKELNNNRERNHSNFHLNNFRYGLIAHLGIAKTNFFVKYDLNPLFKPGFGPDVRAISFGIGL
ncbi:outer membrane beta-barrel protein [Nibrella saemangeumensis]